MKSPPTSLLARGGPRSPGRPKGFTLVELMVAITILVVIVLLFGQMLGIMSKAWTFGHGRANNFTKARAMLELLAQDIQDGVFRSDLATFPSGAGGTGAVAGSAYTPIATAPPIWEFYTGRPGIPAASTTASALRNLSVVSYSLVYNSSATDPAKVFALERADGSILWTDEATNPSFGTPPAFPATGPTQRDTAPGVIAFEIIFVQADGSLNRIYTPVSTGGVANANPTRAISVSIAVIDDQTIKQLSPAQILGLNTSLSALPTSGTAYNLTMPVKAAWDAYLNGSIQLNSTTMQWSSYPAGLGGGLATFERTINLPNAP